MTRGKKYQGWPSYSCWNVALYAHNTYEIQKCIESLVDAVIAGSMSVGGASAKLFHMMHDYFGPRTPDHVNISHLSCRIIMQCAIDDHKYYLAHNKA